ncbi:UvrD-helicase domain-containing protein [Desulfocurvus vexinensis]|uniref:UvrD-helicase domain-containing protein n=1 Tax=Desulfocurvus vexinensis TaxID=399548 RepID=UPI00048F6AE1|nr:UvrD-helicase domain-containing protein [Desulfocurvus vexinensis]
MPDAARFIQLKASAGAGKTYALTGRFLELLAGSDAGDDAPPACARAAAPRHGWPEIMAVTFTNKAAAEMKERVVGRLKACALGRGGADDAPWSRDEAALWLARILRRYDQLNIRTIDSLLHLVMRLFALEAGLAPDFQALFGLEEVFDDLLDPVLAAAEDHDGPERRLLASALETMLHLEGRPGFLLGGHFRERLGKVLAWRLKNDAPCETDPRRIHAALAALHADLARVARAVQPLLDGLQANANFVKFLDKCAASTPGGKLPSDTFATKASVDDCLNAASRGRGSAALDAAYAALCEAYAACASQGPVLRTARDMAALVALADLMLAVLDGLQATRNVLPTARCEAMVATMLAECGAPDAFCRLGTRLRHMLVDEFQDTSRTQWRALSPLAEECLSKGGSVLLVGDVKQAIYGWRGGDARLFDEVPAQPELAAMAPPVRASLPHNWRSRPEVVAFNNAFFTRLETPETARAVAAAMLQSGPPPAVDLLAQAMTEAFAGCVQTLPPSRKPPENAGGFVRLTRVEPPDGNKDALAEAVRAHLRELFAELRTRRAPGEVAVLVRDNTEAALVAGWLLDWGLPVITENSLALGAHPLVRQLVAWLRFLDYPLDDLALWEFVSGEEIFLPCAGLTRTGLTDWLAGQDHGGLYQRLREAWPDVAERFLARCVRKAGFMTPYDAVSEAVRDLRVLERHPDGAPYVRRFMEIVHQAEREGHQSLAAFLDFWDAGASGEKVPLPESVDAVRIMTIHQAKGLEFPVVVVPFHHWRFEPGGEPTPVDCQGLRLLAPLRREMGPAYHEHAARTLLEQLDLLYVAWTRAEEELYCLLTATTHYRSQRPLVRALELLTAEYPWDPGPDGWPTCTFGAAPAAPAGAAPAPPEADAPAPPACAPAPEADPEPPMAWLPRLKIHRHFSHDVPREALFGGGPVFDARARGTLVHDALDRLRRPGGLDPERAARAAVAVHTDLLPPGEAAREAVAAEVRGILDWVLGLPEFPGWAERGHPECPILTPEGTERRPDLLVTDAHETVVVEYKTGQPSPDHERQVRDYMALLAAMDGAARVAPAMRAVILYLDLKTVREVRP